MKGVIESAIKRANQKADTMSDNKPPRRIAMSIFRSTSAVFASMQSEVYELRDSWIVDSGADIHICNDRDRYLTYEPIDDHWAMFGTTQVQIHGYGSIEILAKGMNSQPHILELKRVAYIPECHTNILSTFQIKKNGFYLNQRTNVIEDRHGRPICRTEEKFNQEVVEYNPIPPAAIFAMKRYSEKPHQAVATSKRWHQRLAHLSDEAILHLDETSIGTKVISCEKSICETCRLAKSKKKISRTPREKATTPFEIVHFDVIGLTPAHNGDRWITHFVCESTGWHKIYTYLSKTQLNDLIKQFITWVQTQFGIRPKKLFSDNERSLGNTYINEMDFKGIEIFHSAPYIDEHKGFIERAGRTLIEMARSMRIAANLPEKLWPQIFQTAVYLHNRRPRKAKVKEKIDGKEVDIWIWTTPYEKLYGKKPSLANLRVYGCRAYVRDKKIPLTKKLDPRAWVGYLVGYTASNIWEIWNPLKGTITNERDVTFNEDIVFDPYQPFHADAIRISELPQPPTEVYESPEVKDIPNLVHEEDDELEEVEAQGVSDVQVNDRHDEGSVPNKASGQDIVPAESPKRDLAPLTPEATPTRPIQYNHPVNSIEQDDTPTPRPAPARSHHELPGGWIDSSQQESTPIQLELQTPRSPTRIADSPESQTPIRLTDTLPESPTRLEPDQYNDIDDSPSKQLMEEVQRMSIDPVHAYNDDEISHQPTHSISADFSEENIITGKRTRRPRQFYGYTVTDWMDGLKQFHSVFAAFSHDLDRDTPLPLQPTNRLHRDEIPPPPKTWRDIDKHPLKELFRAAAELEHNALVARGTFKKVRKPTGRQIIPLMWVFTYKFDQEGYLIKAKARICVRGDLQ